VLAGGDTVGLRAPAHPVAQALLRACDLPLAAPSANASNALSPTTAAAVLDTLDGRIDAVLDGGACTVGLESTVLDLVSEIPRILRPGIISADEIACVLGLPSLAAGGSATGHPLRSPGQLARHYAPRIPLVLVADPAAIAVDTDAVISFSESPTAGRFHTRLPRDPVDAARALYLTLREAERSGATRIVMQIPPVEDPAWGAVWDRLRRAATPGDDPAPV
jgi:L-threonylcarbamoyladenylate synthase